ncbi:MAG TPA: heparan-alpha-glucosaminide N-acetyltransferase domain-containing protein [Bryobacteraceae bacterium]|nr:heparan-alpha-glucosaminide N-acetyltransferase domain-containing protein [Bryobacteraceae bacterium]
MIAIETNTNQVASRNNRDTGGRLTFLDWSRGLAVVTMLQGHVFHSFNRTDLRSEGPFMLSQFFGGMGPAVFLVLTGITLAFLMNRVERQGLSALGRWKAALRRAGYLFTLAFLFRLQLWLFAYPQSPWTDLFKVDILNCMGFAIALMSVMALFTTADRVRLCAGLGLAIAIVSPLASSMNWSWLPPQLSAYIVPSYQYFAFFPWASFIAFGLSIGSLLRLAKPEQMNRIMQWGALAGLALAFGGQYFSNLPYTLYPKSEFWLDSPGLIVIKLGAVMLLFSFAYLWTEFVVGNSWSWVRQLGTTSLLVYWVHIELVYGRWFGTQKETLSNLECALYAVVVIALMVAISLLKTHWGKTVDTLTSLFRYDSPRRVSGD